MHDKIETRTFLLTLLLVSCGFLWLLIPFFGAIFWAIAIAIVFHPVQQRLLKRWPTYPNLAVLATLLLCIVVVILPLMIVISSVIDEGVAIYEKINSGEINPAQYIEQVHTAFPRINALLSRVGIDLNNIKTDATDAVMASGKFLAQHTFTIGQNAFSFLCNLALMLYITFFMLRDGNQLVELLVRALPLGDAHERTLFGIFTEVTRATIKGNIVVAIVQGSVGGLTLWALGIHGALLLAVLMMFASLIPAVGSALVWAPVAIYLAAKGSISDALILVGVGVAVIGMLDNILRPILVGRDTQLPDYLVLLSTLGGIGIFGLNGFVIGPLVAALFLACWGIFIHEVHLPRPDKDHYENGIYTGDKKRS
ncbi:MAG TPA: AI-2E family transporter [Cellvibrio sp.]|nr:AI-2E family transporter [Cellvibrio sp.]